VLSGEATNIIITAHPSGAPAFIARF